MDYLDVNLDLSEDDIALRKAAHQFAKEVMRPVAKELDVMSADDVIAEGSPLWPFLKQAYELGYHKCLLPEHYGGLGFSPRQVSLVFEELGWGSFGLAVKLAVVCFPFYMACMTGEDELIEEFVLPFCECNDASIRGCWAITEPDHGSDMISGGEDYFYSDQLKCNCSGRIEGDEVVINGQKSAWVSAGTIATHALLHFQIDRSHGVAGCGVAIVPLDLPGVAKGRPLEKIGQRDLNQGEIYFDEVRIPKKWLVAEPDYYEPIFDMIINSANLCMASWATGLARAAFEEAFQYSKERIVGLKPMIEHYSTKQRIFQLFQRVETSRAVTRAMIDMNLNISPPHLEYSAVAKTFATQACLDNAHEAIQLLGGNGLTREYLTEKLFRDARATLIEDGCNEVLFRHGGHALKETYPRPPLEF